MAVKLKSRSRLRLPRALPPTQIEREYASDLMKILDVVQYGLKPLFDALPGVLDDHAIRVDSHFMVSVPPTHAKTLTAAEILSYRMDAGPGKISELADRARAILSRALTPGRTGAIVDKIAEKTSKHAKAQLKKQLTLGLKISPVSATAMIKDKDVDKRLEAFAAENAQLIKGLGEDVISQIEKLSLQALTSGESAKSLAKKLVKRFDVGDSRAKFIARDQIGKLNGQLQIMRHKGLGVTHFYWMDSGDERVRGMPGGRYQNAIPSHHARNDKRYPIDSPPDGEYPGEPAGCRCNPEPDLSTVGE